MGKFDLFKIAPAIFFLLLVNFAALAQDVPKFEAGAQFSVLSLTRPHVLVGGGFGLSLPCCDRVIPGVGRRTEPGFGARFTFNLTNNVAFEAEGNLFPRREGIVSMPDGHVSTPGGRVFQGQFGIKAGKRFRRFGVFGKARPGFVGFTEVSKLISTFTVGPIGTQVFTVGIFDSGKEIYFSTDLGGVVEFYRSRRIVSRIDVGDTIIRYGTYRAGGTFLSRAIIERPPETKHNLQFSARPRMNGRSIRAPWEQASLFSCETRSTLTCEPRIPIGSFPTSRTTRAGCREWISRLCTTTTQNCATRLNGPTLTARPGSLKP